MISTYSMGLYYGLGWTLIESYYRPYGRSFLKGRLAWLEPWMLYLVWGALLLGPNLVAGGLLIGLGVVNAVLGKLLKSKQVSLIMALLLLGASLYAAKVACVWPYKADWLWTALYALWLGAPVNQLFHFLFRRFQPEIEIDDATIEGSGATIGILERLITGLLLVSQNYAALGLVFTAKSIARYDKISKNSAFAEYYLIGSLFSLLAVLVLYQVYQLGSW